MQKKNNAQNKRVKKVGECLFEYKGENYAGSDFGGRNG